MKLDSDIAAVAAAQCDGQPNPDQSFIEIPACVGPHESHTCDAHVRAWADDCSRPDCNEPPPQRHMLHVGLHLSAVPTNERQRIARGGPNTIKSIGLRMFETGCTAPNVQRAVRSVPSIT